MKNIMSREIRLVSCPTGIPTAANFAMAGIELAPMQSQQVLVRNLYMSVDPYMRGRVNDGNPTCHRSSWENPLRAAPSARSSNRAPGNSSRAMPSLPTWAGGNTLGVRPRRVRGHRALECRFRRLRQLSVGSTS